MRLPDCGSLYAECIIRCCSWTAIIAVTTNASATEPNQLFPLCRPMPIGIMRLSIHTNARTPIM